MSENNEKASTSQKLSISNLRNNAITDNSSENDLSQFPSRKSLNKNLPKQSFMSRNSQNSSIMSVDADQLPRKARHSIFYLTKF